MPTEDTGADGVGLDVADTGDVPDDGTPAVRYGGPPVDSTAD